MKIIRCVVFFISFFIEIDVKAEPFTKIAVEKHLTAELMQKVTITDFEISTDTWQSNWTDLTEDKPLTIVELDVTPDQKKFYATISWGDVKNGGNLKKISGKIQKYRVVPVLTNSIAHQSEIKESDIKYVRFVEEQLYPGMILNKEDLIGKVLKNGRSLQLDKPLQISDVEVPVVIKKGEEVRVIYIDPFFEISIVATARNNGSVGERISFDVGTEKKKIIQARVVSAGLAEIREMI